MPYDRPADDTATTGLGAKDTGAALPLCTGGPEVDCAVVAACAHHGVAVRPGLRAGVLLAGP